MSYLITGEIENICHKAEVRTKKAVQKYMSRGNSVFVKNTVAYKKLKNGHEIIWDNRKK